MTDAITWTPTTVPLSALKPWPRNPKTISRKAAERLLKNWQELGQFQTIAVGPSGEVYDGHQRLNVLKAAYGLAYRVTALQSSRELTEQERERLTIEAHVGAVGQFDWDALAAWDTDALQGWGMDADALGSWETDVAALKTFLESEASEKELTELTEPIRPRQMLRVLISFPVDVAADVRDSINAIIATYGGEAIFGAN